MDSFDKETKINPIHRELICRMMGVKEVPDDVFARYRTLRKLIDRVDGHLTAADLAFVVLGGNVTAEPVQVKAEPAKPEPKSEESKPADDEQDDEPEDVTGDDADEPEPAKPETVEEGRKVGDFVRVFWREDIAEGEITAIEESDNGEKFYTVKVGNETETFAEEDIE